MSASKAKAAPSPGVSVNPEPSAPAPSPRNIPRTEQRKMVGWYDPRQLAKTAVEVLISTIFGRHSDHRLVEAVASGPASIIDYTLLQTREILLDRPEAQGFAVVPVERGEPGVSAEASPAAVRKELWIDYVSDIGDGWNSTYAIASAIAGVDDGTATIPTRTFPYHNKKTGSMTAYETVRGEILVFGGDEVYPTASRKEYNERTVRPYNSALSNATTHPDIFAIPGNHDWYDSLVAFTRLFCVKNKLAQCKTLQGRSYFALKLPHGWWLLGTDVQLASDIDRPQIEYFTAVAAQIEPGDRIILCHAEPHWIYANLYEDLDDEYDEKNIAVLEGILGRRVAVFIAGDLHNYRRYQATDGSGTQKITAGGGGAFMHPTHSGLLGKKLRTIYEFTNDTAADGTRAERGISREFRQESCFPSERTSAWLTCRNLLFPFFVFMGNSSWSFGLLTGALYLLTTIAVIVGLGRTTIGSGPGNGTAGSVSVTNVIGLTLHSIIYSNVTMLWVALLLLGFVLFTDTHSKAYRLVMGTVHGLAHILAAFTLASLAIFVLAHLNQVAFTISFALGQFPFAIDLRVILAALAVLAGGYVVGCLIMGIYLLISQNIFGRHYNEAFSGLAVEDWKSFLRLHIDGQGNLTIYPIGISKVPRKWKVRSGNEGPDMIPDGALTPDMQPALIEAPIFLERKPEETGVCDTGIEAPESRASAE